MGHGGLLTVAKRGTTSRRFVFWLVRRINYERRGIRLGDGSFRSITEADAGEVLGVGGGDIEIPFPHNSPTPDVLGHISMLLGVGYIADKITINLLENVLLAPGEPETEALKNRFRVAFALLCDACIFNPVPTKDAAISAGSLMNVIDPAKISHLNWRRYALDKLFAVAKRIQQEVADGRDSFHIDCCWLIPQVGFLFQTARTCLFKSFSNLWWVQPCDLRGNLGRGKLYCNL
jgi:hypothetical protein